MDKKLYINNDPLKMFSYDQPESLRIVNCSVKVFPDWKSLKKIYIDYCDITKEAVIRLFKKNAIEKIEMHNCEIDFLGDLFPFCYYVTRMIICDRESLSYQTIGHLTWFCNRLNDLTIQDCLIGDFGAEKLFEKEFYKLSLNNVGISLQGASKIASLLKKNLGPTELHIWESVDPLEFALIIANGARFNRSLKCLKFRTNGDEHFSYFTGKVFESILEPNVNLSEFDFEVEGYYEWKFIARNRNKSFRDSIYMAILCLQKIGVVKDIARKIGRIIFEDRQKWIERPIKKIKLNNNL